MASSPALADHVRNQEWWLRTLHVTRAWRSTQGTGVTVALLDTGVDPKQADLTGSVITGPDYTSSGRTAGGPFWGIHGTAMATLIVGHGHGAGDHDGIIGIAPAAKILSVRVTLEGNDPLLASSATASGLPKAIARGIRYAVKQHATVIDLPLDPATMAGGTGSGGSPAERAAVAYALARGVVLVAPAGDNGAGNDAVSYPAAYPGVISVGAFGPAFMTAPYSSHRSYVSVTGAGNRVTAANGTGGYAPVHSTSAASAVVAGIVALIRAQFPRLTPAQVKTALITSTVHRPKGGYSDGAGYGTVDAAAALTAASRLAEAVPSTAASAGSGAGAKAPAAPAVHSTVVSKNLGHSLMTDAGIAVAIFAVLLGIIFGTTTWRRRRARSARLAEVRAATRVPARSTRPTGTAKSAGKTTSGGTAKSGAKAKSGGKAKSGTAKSGRKTRKPAAGRKPATARQPATAPQPAAAAERAPAMAGNLAWPPPGADVTGAGAFGAGGTAAGVSGAGVAGGFSGSSAAGGFPGAGVAGGFPGAGAAGGFSGASAAGGFSGAGVAGAGMFGAGMAGAGAAGAGLGGAGLGGADLGGAGRAGAGLAGAGGLGLPDALAGRAAGLPGQTERQTEPAGFVPAPLAADSTLPGLGDGPLTSGPASGGPVPSGDAPADSLPAGVTPADSTASSGPPWSLITSDPGTHFRGASHAAIPASAFPAPADAGAEPSGAPGSAGAAGAGRAGGRRAQGSHRASPARAPDVSGNPPWEPAQQPDSELPWTQAPTPLRGGGGLPQRKPAVPAWEAVAEEAWPGGPRAAGPHPPAPAPADPDPASASTPAGLVPRPADPADDARRQARRPLYAWETAASADPVRGAQPGAGALPEAGGGLPAGGDPKTGIPPWEITDSFLAIRTEIPGATRGESSIPTAPAAGTASPHGDVSHPAAPPETPGFLSSGSFPVIPAETSGFLRADASFPASPAETPDFPHGGSSIPESPNFPSGGSSFPASPAESPGFPGGGSSFPTGSAESPGFPGSGSSFPTGSAESPGFPGSESSFPTGSAESPGFPGSGSSFPTGSAEIPSFLRSGGSFPAAPAEPPGFLSGGVPFPGTQDEIPGFLRNGPSFPATSPETPGYPRGGTSFPGGSAETPGFPRGSSLFATPPDTPAFPGATRSPDPAGETTGSFPAAFTGGDQPLPRRIPLSERTGSFPSTASRDENAFRLFPPSDNTDDFPAAPSRAFPPVPPSENTED